jgi:outer membrane protein OmpA-like peptidoglycan-associated protein
MKLKEMFVVLLGVFLTCNVYADCEFAEEKLIEAEGLPLGERLSALQQSIGDCITLDAYILLSDEYHFNQEYNKSFFYLDQVILEMGDDEDAEVDMLNAKRARLYASQGNRCKAIRIFTKLLDKNGEWSPQVNKIYALTDQNYNLQQDLDASTISCVLKGDGGTKSMSTRKGIGVCPRVNIKILFEYGSADIREDSLKQVREMATALNKKHFKRYIFNLIGHTDERGSVQHNNILSKQRAVSVRNEILKQFGSLKARLKASGRGESSPIVKNAENELDHQKNRRVEIKVNCSGT